MVIDYLVKFTRAMAALISQLSNRVAFDQPAPKPLTLFCMSGTFITPAIRVFTRLAKPTLFSIRIQAISVKDY
jgi:hypothetical protein